MTELTDNEELLLEKLNARVEEHLKDCPFDVRVDLVPCQTFPDPWSKLRAKSNAELEEFRRATLEDRWPVVFELPDGTERKMKYRSVEEGEDGALAFTGVEFVDLELIIDEAEESTEDD